MSDPRVRRRIQRVVDWAQPHVADQLQGASPKEMMAVDLRKVFGNYSQPGLSQWLFANLMRQTGFYRQHEFAFKYAFHIEGLEKLLSLLEAENETSHMMYRSPQKEGSRGSQG